MVRRKVFISYHAPDRDLVRAFIDRFDDEEDIFIQRSITMPEDVINSSNPEYVMSRIRQNFLVDSTVTLLAIGKCTWSRRFVDWELQASLRRPANGLPNGLLGILIDPNTERAHLPDRFKLNWKSGYAGYYRYPKDSTQLKNWIETAYAARTTSASKIENPRARRERNGHCE